MLWDQGSKGGIRRVGSGITSHGIGISRFLGDQGSGCTTDFCGVTDQNLSHFWNQGSEIWVQKWDQR